MFLWTMAFLNILIHSIEVVLVREKKNAFGGRPWNNLQFPFIWGHCSVLFEVIIRVKAYLKKNTDQN